MAILRVYEDPVKPGSPTPGPPCPRCKGRGHVTTADAESTCDYCEGHGSVIQVEEEPLIEESPFVATVGDVVLDGGADLGRLVRAMCLTFHETADDIACWNTNSDGLGSVRLAALIRPNPIGSLRDASYRTKRGRSSIQKDVEATLEVEPMTILFDRFLPEGEPTRDPTKPVYLDVRGVVNKNTGSRNVRYRLAMSPDWRCTFTLCWDKTVVSRQQMEAVLRDAGTFHGLGDGLRIGFGRFAVASYEELSNAEEATAEGVVEPPAGDRVEKGQRRVRTVPAGAETDGVPH